MVSDRLNPPNNPWVTDTTVLPRVSIVVPMYNEREYIGSCLDSVLQQDYPHDKMEIHVVDGDSEDGSPEVVKEHYLNRSVPVFLRMNPHRKTPSSLNLGIKAATGDVVVILGAHTELFPDFLKYNVENLRKPNVYCSGGTQINHGKTRSQVSIGAAMSHWFGMASAPYRYRGKPGFVNTVAYGAYRKEIFDMVGYFDETGVISEDSEFNLRITRAGYQVRYDPRIKTRYYPRKSLSELASQMFCYGVLRSQVFRKHKGGLLWLHYLPPISLVLLILVGILSFFSVWVGFLFFGVVAVYLAVSVIAAADSYGKCPGSHPVTVFLAFMVLHLFWSLGFLAGLFKRKAV